jgi:thiol-disulfide isomerase/thioredoxin
MNKRILAVVVTLVVVIGGAGTALALTRIGSAPDAAPSPSQTTTTPEVDEPLPTAEPTEPVSEGAYVEYSESAIAAAEGRVLLFFHAAWCPQCRSIESDIDAQGVPDGVTIIKIDYDSNQQLRQEYGVTLQTTFVEVDSAGEPLQSFVAYDDPHLDAVIDAML